MNALKNSIPSVQKASVSLIAVVKESITTVLEYKQVALDVCTCSCRSKTELTIRLRLPQAKLKRLCMLRPRKRKWEGLLMVCDLT